MRAVPRVYNIYFINILTVAYRDNIIMNTVLYTFNHPINRLKYRVPPLVRRDILFCVRYRNGVQKKKKKMKFMSTDT